MHAVGAMVQRVEQRQQILDMLAPIQPLDFHRLKAQLGRAAADFADQRIEMAAGAHENGDAFGRVIAASRQNQIEDAARFVLGRAVFGALDQRVHADPAIRPRRPGGG